MKNLSIYNSSNLSKQK